MTSQPTIAPPTPPRTAGSYRLTAARLLHAEVLRFVTVRSNLVTLAAVAAILVTIGAVAAATATGDVQGIGPGGGAAPGFSGTDPLGTVLAGQTPAVLVVGVLGVLVGAREYANGMIRTTMTAAPRRPGVLSARVAAFLLMVLPVLLVGTLAAYGVGTAILDAGGAQVAAWSDPGVPRAVVGTALYLTGVGVLGLALGMLTRGTGQGIGWLVGLVLVLPGFGALLLPDDAEEALRYLPSNAGAAFTTVVAGESRLEPAAGAAVFVAWLLAALGATAVLLRRRDV